MSLPLCSFLMPTLGRSARQPHVINTAVYYYSIMDWPNKELIVLNDAEGVTMTCRVPGVRVVNWPHRIPYLSMKMRMLCGMARGEYLYPLEDDDVSLPWRAEQGVKKLQGFEYWSPGRYWFHPFGAKLPMISQNNGVAHTCGCYRRSTWHGYDVDVNRGHDGVAKAWAFQNLKVNPEVLTDDSLISFVYTWGTSEMHLSAQGENVDHAYATQYGGNPGTYEIIPEMGEFDYVKWHHDLTAPRTGS